MASSRPNYTHQRCIACASEETSKNLCPDDESFGKLMKFFWEGLSVEVKPLDSMKHEFCEPCQTKIIEFYDTNQVLVQLEKHLRNLQKTLIRTCVGGIEKLKEDGHPLLPVHKNLFEKWGSGFKSEDEDEKMVTNDDRTVDTFLEESEKVDNPVPVSTKKSPVKKRPAPRGRRSTKTKKKLDDDEESSDFATSTSESEPEASSEEID